LTHTKKVDMMSYVRARIQIRSQMSISGFDRIQILNTC
jgi:hypothetical protein